MADITIDELCPRATDSAARRGGMIAEDAWAHYDRGIAWAQVGAYEQALEAWHETLRLAPEMAEAHAAAGDAYMALGCWHEAVCSYQHAIQAGPQLLAGYYGLGAAHGRQGDYDRAIAVYNQAFQLLNHNSAVSPQAVVSDIDAPDQNLFPTASSPLTGYVRPGSDGFDFSALLSSPAERRQAVRQEQMPIEPMSLREAHATPRLGSAVRAETVAPKIADTAPDPQAAENHAMEAEAGEEEYVVPARERHARVVLAVALTVLGCMGGRMAVSAINEAHERDAYLAATRAAQMRRTIPTSPTASTPTRVQE